MRPAQPITRLLGGLAILAMGALHLQQYLDGQYRSIPTIGTLFLLNFAGAIVIGGVLLTPIKRLLGAVGEGRRAAPSAVRSPLMAAVAIAFLLISEQTPLFGFMEVGYKTPMLVALISEGLAVLALAGFLLSSIAGPGRRRAR